MAIPTFIEANRNGTEWTIRLKEGITTHKGKDFGAQDVLFSFQRIMDNNFPGVTSLGDIDLQNARVVDARTLTVPFKSPYAIFMSALACSFRDRIPKC